MTDAELIGAVHSSIYRQCKQRGYAAPVDVLMDIGVLPKKQYEAWRNGKIRAIPHRKKCQIPPSVI